MYVYTQTHIHRVEWWDLLSLVQNLFSPPHLNKSHSVSPCFSFPLIVSPVQRSDLLCWHFTMQKYLVSKANLCMSQCLWRPPFFFPPTLTLRSCGCAAQMVANQGAVLLRAVGIALAQPYQVGEADCGLLSSVSVLRSWLRRNKTSAVIWSNSRFPVFPGILSNLWIFYLTGITGRVATGNLLYLVKQELNKNRLHEVKLKSVGDCIFCLESVGSIACSVLQLCAAFSHPAAARKVLSHKQVLDNMV